MPMGSAPWGYAYFVGVKLAGYTGAAAVIRRWYPEFRGRTFVVGLARTAIGIAMGAAYGALWFALAEFLVHAKNPNALFYLAALLPVRMAEWALLVYLFFDRSLMDRRKALWVCAGGTVWSYCLDVIGIAAALVVPGGAWIC
jgi:hypothetical protein